MRNEQRRADERRWDSAEEQPNGQAHGTVPFKQCAELRQMVSAARRTRRHLTNGHHGVMSSITSPATTYGGHERWIARSWGGDPFGV